MINVMNTSATMTMKTARIVLQRALQLLLAIAALFIALLVQSPSSYALAEKKPSPPSEVIRLINEERAKVGVSPLVEDPSLIVAAGLRAREAAQRFSHTRPNGSKWNTIFFEFEISAYRRGENLAYGQKTPKRVVRECMQSKWHCRNILDESFDRVAVGLYIHNGVSYWSQLFIQSTDDEFEPRSKLPSSWRLC